MKRYCLALLMLIFAAMPDKTGSAIRGRNTLSGVTFTATGCPNIYIVECPGLDRKDDTYTIMVKVEGVNPDQKLTYHWTVYGGELKSGQGTSSITVKVGDLRKETFTARVKVCGVPEGCSNTASCSVAI